MREEIRRWAVEQALRHADTLGLHRTDAEAVVKAASALERYVRSGDAAGETGGSAGLVDPVPLDGSHGLRDQVEDISPVHAPPGAVNVLAFKLPDLPNELEDQTFRGEAFVSSSHTDFSIDSVGSPSMVEQGGRVSNDPAADAPGGAAVA